MLSVGQKVVLVDDKWPETVKQLYLQLPVLDTVYVVRAVRVGVKCDELIMDMRRVLEPSILLMGIYNPSNQSGRGGRVCGTSVPCVGRVEERERRRTGRGRGKRSGGLTRLLARRRAGVFLFKSVEPFR